MFDYTSCTCLMFNFKLIIYLCRKITKHMKYLNIYFCSGLVRFTRSSVDLKQELDIPGLFKAFFHPSQYIYILHSCFFLTHILISISLSYKHCTSYFIIIYLILQFFSLFILNFFII